MSSPSPESESEGTVLSLACEKDNHEVLHALSTSAPGSPLVKGVRLNIDRVGLSANNKFYLGFGDKPPFSFFQAYPVSSQATVVNKTNNGKKITTENLVHPPGWGIATVTESSHAEIPVGAKFRAMLPLANQVHFDDIVPKNNESGDFSVVRPSTHPAYNDFSRLPEKSIMAAVNQIEAGIALVTWPGTVTGFGLYHQLEQDHFYRTKDGEVPILVLTSGSSKVSLALAFYIRQKQAKGEAQGVEVWGLTSASNVAFCQKTGLYEKVLEYDDDKEMDAAVADKKLVMVDVAGRGEVYQRLEPNIIKAWSVGNSHNVPDNISTFKNFSLKASIKMMWTMMGLPGGWLINKLINPKLELFLIMTINAKLAQEWGAEVHQQRFEQFMTDFAEAAAENNWMTVKRCADLSSIREGYTSICQGNIPPSEVVLLDVGAAVKGL
jgi:hypothetical protein